jgi:hypothetical protein
MVLEKISSNNCCVPRRIKKLAVAGFSDVNADLILLA